MKAKINVLFYLRKSKVNAIGRMPIFQRITVNGQRFDISTGHYVDESKWSSEISRMKGNSEEAHTVNSQLELFKANVYETEKRLFMKEVEITFESFKLEHLGKSERTRTLIPIFQDHNNKIKALIGKEYAPGTLERYVTSLKHTKDFLMWKYNITDIDITKIDHAFVTDYEFYLRTVRNCANLIQETEEGLIGKKILREEFADDLPKEIIERSKMSFDVGSGIRKLVVEYLTQNGKTEKQQLKEIWNNYFSEKIAKNDYFNSYPTFDIAIEKRGINHK
ncbi:phage integrase SAM-like domain-containing protein [Flavobacterium sp.]|uniref:phage integrase SAM-like domain-containing protein n=1 Tax=Flavobacterium sp. TaxID=239 RepID=UPI0025B8A3F9|nr:phage integrase SAM-like domain-containing protein [Flavobacterium sp.]MBA4155426.1 hypothetical protein [Flavobacterium sp.]